MDDLLERAIAWFALDSPVVENDFLARKLGN
jgi:hypothetical protein